jgi:imidazoleglycerol-phosphate dehydratase
MISLLAHHGALDLTVKARGDIEVDFHHTVEDIGICLGEGLRKALGEPKGITRYGMALTPMDETLASIALDLSRRPCLVYHVKLRRAKIGNFDLELVEEFFRAFCNHGGITLHINLLYGRNTHHMVEAIFKGVGQALRMALSIDPRSNRVPSSKGVL